MNTKIYPSNIDLDKLSEALINDYAFNHGDKTDVTHVDGVDSKFIAKAATRTVDGTEFLIKDRQTVESALFLHNTDTDTAIPASDVVTKEQFKTSLNETLDNSQSKTNRHASDEMISVRSELYALISSLSKKGILSNYYAENGFLDPFASYDKRCSIEDICSIAQTGTISAGFTQHIYISKDDAAKVKPGFYYIVEKTFADKTKLYEVVFVYSCTNSADNDLTDCTVYDIEMSDVGLNLKNKNDLYTEMPTMVLKAIHGQYVNNTFSFSKTDTFVETGNVNEISFDDDSLTISVPTVDNDENPAFAFSFRVPANKAGVLKSLTVYGTTDGQASDLRCYILKDDDKTSVSAQSLDERYIAGDETIIGRSRQVFLSSLTSSETWSVDNKITFTFADEIDGKYKISLANETYLIVIVKTNPEATGIWKFLFSRNPASGNDVQTYNKAYTYHRNAAGQYVFDEKAYKYDLMYSIITEIVLNKKEVGYTNGLYTSQEFNMYNKASDIALAMTINREGLFRVANNATVNGSNNDPIVIELDTGCKTLNSNTLGYNYGIKSGDTIVIGNQILTIKKENSDNRIFVNEDNIAITAYDKVYKVGYRPYIMLYRKDSDGNDIIDTYPMYLDSVANNPERTNETSSDKLIFKVKDIINHLPTFSNTFFDKVYYKGKIAIAWNSTAPEQYFAEGEYSNNNFIGRIYSLVISGSNILGL